MLNQSALDDLTIYRVLNISMELLDSLSDEDAATVMGSGGKNGEHYRREAVAAIKKALALQDSGFAQLSDANKSFKITVTAASIGMLLGTTSSLRTLNKNVKAYMDSRSKQNDPLATAWKVLQSSFVTYVSESSLSKFPSVKYPSCMPDFCLMGIMVLAAGTKSNMHWRNSFLDAAGAIKPMTTWDPLFQKSFIGNFHLTAEAQAKHKAWEKHYWDSVVTSTRNASNRATFVRGFTEEFYANTVSDRYKLFSYAFRFLSTVTSEGYDWEDVVNYILKMIALIKKRRNVADATPAWNSSVSESAAASAAAEVPINSFLSGAVFADLIFGVVGRAGLVKSGENGATVIACPAAEEN